MQESAVFDNSVTLAFKEAREILREQVQAISLLSRSMEIFIEDLSESLSLLATDSVREECLPNKNRKSRSTNSQYLARKAQEGFGPLKKEDIYI